MTIRRAVIAMAVLSIIGSVLIWRGTWGDQDSVANSTRRLSFCKGRVAAKFDAFWTNLSGRELDKREAYRISAIQPEQPKGGLISLSSCSRMPSGGRLQCIVASANPEAGLRKGDSYLLERKFIANWTYARGLKLHHGCDLSRALGFSLARQRCERAARDRFPDFEWAIAAKKIGPQDHWIDIDIENTEQKAIDGDDRGRWKWPMEARLNRCQRNSKWQLVCRIDSAPPEAGLRNDDTMIV
jgi:hypothetical protein